MLFYFIQAGFDLLIMAQRFVSNKSLSALTMRFKNANRTRDLVVSTGALWMKLQNNDVQNVRERCHVQRLTSF